MAIDSSAAGPDLAALPHSSRRDSLRTHRADAGQLCHCVAVMTGNHALERSFMWSGFGLMVAGALPWPPKAASTPAAAGAQR
jgi:hypothetical protein